MSDTGMNEASARDQEFQAERRSEDVAIQDVTEERERLIAHADQRQARSGVEHEQAQAWAYDDWGYRSPRR